jgi:L-lactate dehydrogenase complex protein LldG
MQKIADKDKVLQDIRAALQQATAIPYPDERGQLSQVFPPPDDDLAFIFAQRLIEAKGQLIYCESVTELADNLKQLIQINGWRHVYAWEKDIQKFLQSHDIREARIGKQLDRAEVGLTTCEALVARTGSILLSSRQASGRSLSIFPPIHIVLTHHKQLYYDLSEALQATQDTYKNKMPSMLSITTGPSRTADIEKTLVQGAHGPKELYVLFLDNQD